MDRAPELLAALSTTKRCTDCAHLLVNGAEKLCGRTIAASLVTGEPRYTNASIERVFETSTGCGPKAIHFLPSDVFQANRSVRRTQLQQAIESAITDLSPTPNEADEIVAAVQASLQRRYSEERLTDVVSAYKEYSDALQEADQ